MGGEQAKWRGYFANQATLYQSLESLRKITELPSVAPSGSTGQAVERGTPRYEIATAVLDWTDDPLVFRSDRHGVWDTSAASRRLFLELRPRLEDGWDFYPDAVQAVEYKTSDHRNWLGDVDSETYWGALVQLRRLRG